MSHIYLTSDDVKVGISQGRLTVKCPDNEEEERSVPLSDVESVNVFGVAQLSTQLIRQCLKDGIPVGYFTEDGHYFGRISAAEGIDPERHKRQISLTDNYGFCLGWSKRIIHAKLANSLAMLQSFSSTYAFDASEIHGIQHSLAYLKSANTVDMVLGFEGNAAKTYFQCLGRLIENREFSFSGRSSRPPKDPVNAMLSYGYTLFQRNIIGAIERHGLHPYFAYMHKIKRGHAALASDVIEELRAFFVDRVVIHFVNSGSVSVSDFNQGENGGVYMARATMKQLTDAFSEEMAARRAYFSAYGDGKKYSFQSMLDKKICGIIDAVEHKDSQRYLPVLWEECW